MNRDKFFGMDASVKLVFSFLYDNNQKKISFFIEYSNDEELEVAKKTLSLYGFFWDTGSTADDLISTFMSDPSVTKLGLKNWFETH